MNTEKNVATEVDRFYIFEGIENIEQGTTWMQFIKIIEEHACETKGLDIKKVHNDFRDQYIDLLMTWHQEIGFSDMLRQVRIDHADMLRQVRIDHAEQSIDLMVNILEMHLRFSLDDIMRLLEIWKEIFIKNEVFELIPSIDLGREYIQHLRLKQETCESE